MKFAISFPILALVLTLCGCAQEQESLHEHDHEVPAHWPGSMHEAAEFIENRVNLLGSTGSPTASSPDSKELQQAQAELADLIEWTPEVAADTDLLEADWVPLYDLSESIRGELQNGVEVPKLTDEMEKLCKLLREAHSKLSSETVSPIVN